MTRRLGFTVDLASCTGCKACQVACKDKHDLAPGLLWRKVAEVEGGSWSRRKGEQGDVWRDETFTYFVSLSCMHCEKPICVEVCPTKAMTKGDDGVVAVDPDRCMGCRYCEWACPYAAPQFDAAAGVMTKCDLCRDRLAEGRRPACVDACQMRVLDVRDFAEGFERRDEVFPLPPADLTAPPTDMNPHRDVEKAARSGARVANREEI